MADTPDPDMTDPDMTDPAAPDRGAPHLGATMLPALEPARRRAHRPLLLGTALLGVLLVVVIALVLRRGGAGDGAAAGSSGASTTPVVADSGRALADTATVRSEVTALLGRKLPSAHTTVPSAAPVSDARLAPSLSLGDPALPGCVGALESGGALLGVDRVTYRGALSLVVVVSGQSASQAVAYVIGPGCSAPGADGIRTIVTAVR